MRSRGEKSEPKHGISSYNVTYRFWEGDLGLRSYLALSPSGTQRNSQGLQSPESSPVSVAHGGHNGISGTYGALQNHKNQNSIFLNSVWQSCRCIGLYSAATVRPQKVQLIHVKLSEKYDLKCSTFGRYISLAYF